MDLFSRLVVRDLVPRSDMYPDMLLPLDDENRFGKPFVPTVLKLLLKLLLLTQISLGESVWNKIAGQCWVLFVNCILFANVSSWSKHCLTSGII